MERPCLNDKNEYPDDSALKRHLGVIKPVWDKFTGLFDRDYPGITGEWRYYNDGKSWLFKVTNKKGTICWVSVWNGMFKVSFYFGDKAENLIADSEIDDAYKQQFINGKKYGKIRAVTVDVKKAVDLVPVKLLTEIKTKLK